MSPVQAIAADLVELFDDGIAPIYVLDDRRRIVFCNTACARWAGTTTAELLGQECAFHTPPETLGPAAIAAGLCPPPKVFCGQAETGLISRREPDGRWIYRRAHFFPLDDGQDESTPVLVVLDHEDRPGPDLADMDVAKSDASSDGALHEQLRRFRHQMAGRFSSESLVGTSPLIVKARTQIELAARARASVLCVGPPGVGKAHAAKAVHYAQRDPGPLVPVSCAVVETNVLRSTLRALWFKYSTVNESSPTLILEDVDLLSPEAQSDLVSLLRADPLQVRIIATSCKPRDELVVLLSAELVCALSTITIELPPLGERLEDLPLLAQAFLEAANAGQVKQLGGFTSEALDQLLAFPWQGNLDELAQIVREAHERARWGEIAAGDLPDRVRWASDAASYPPRVDESIDLEEFLARLEKELITRALRRAKGNKSKAAKLLGLTRPRLYRRLIQLGLEQDEGKGPDSDARPAPRE